MARSISHPTPNNPLVAPREAWHRGSGWKRMQWVAVPQRVRASRAPVPPDQRLASRSGAPPRTLTCLSHAGHQSVCERPRGDPCASGAATEATASVACLWATGCGAGAGQQPRNDLGVNLPIGSHDSEVRHEAHGWNEATMSNHPYFRNPYQEATRLEDAAA
jgi:hypothetical protein